MREDGGKEEGKGKGLNWEGLNETDKSQEKRDGNHRADEGERPFDSLPVRASMLLIEAVSWVRTRDHEKTDGP